MLSVLTLTLSACTGVPIRAYPGVEQPPEKLAVLKHQTGFNNPSVYFVQIDGARLSGRQYADVKLLPGRHVAEFGFEAVRWFPPTYEWSTENATVIFDAEANHEYEARADRASGFWGALSGRVGWKGIIVDLHSGGIVGRSAVGSPT